MNYFLPLIVLGGNTLNEMNQRNRRKFDGLFPPHYIVLEVIIFNEVNQRNSLKFDELFPPIYIFFGRKYIQSVNLQNYFLLFIMFWEEFYSMKQIGVNFMSYL